MTQAVVEAVCRGAAHSTSKPTQLVGGDVRPGDAVRVEPPAPPHRPLEPV